LGDKFQQNALALYNKYFPIEIDAALTIEQKLPYMLEWYEKNHVNMIECSSLCRADIYEKSLSDSVIFRECAVDTIKYAKR